MISKRFGLLSLILGLILSLLVIGCGGDEDDDKVGDTSYLGSWEIVTIGGKTFEETFTEDDGQQEGIEQSVELISNDWLFNADGYVVMAF